MYWCHTLLCVIGDKHIADRWIVNPMQSFRQQTKTHTNFFESIFIVVIMRCIKHLIGWSSCSCALNIKSSAFSTGIECRHSHWNFSRWTYFSTMRTGTVVFWNHHFIGITCQPPSAWAIQWPLARINCTCTLCSMEKDKYYSRGLPDLKEVNHYTWV